MQDNPQYFPAANWCDVFAHPDGWAFVRSEGSVIICVVNDVERWRFDVGQKVLYLRGASAPDGMVVAIMQGNNDGLCWCLGLNGKVANMGPTWGQDCTAIVWEDGGFVAYILRSETTYSRLTLADGEDVVHECVQTSQGWLDVVGGLQWTDANRDRTVNDITVALPFERGDVVVGQATSGNLEQVTALLPSGEASTVIRGTSYEPRVAVTVDGVYAVCARTLRGAALALCPPWPAYDTGVEVPVPPPVPVPPVPTPQPPTPNPAPSMSKIPSAVIATIHAFVSAYPIPRGDGSEDWIESALRRIPDGWMHKLAQTIAARHGVKWGRKRASATRPLSKESIALNEHGLHGWDLLAGASTGRPTLKTDSYHDLVAEDNQIFVPVEPFDHLSTIVAPTNRPTIQTPLWGLSSFDLGTRLAERSKNFPHGDRRWIDERLKPAGLVARLIVASYFRRPVNEDAMTTQEKLAISRVRFRETLKTLKSDGLQCEPTLLCDTAKFDLSRAEALEEVWRMKPILQEFRETIRGASGGNELSHDVEMPYMQESAFHDEVAAILGPEFPYTPGAGHGGEGVRIFPSASYCVHHAPRDTDAVTNAATLKRAQDLAKRPVVDREQIGVAEPGTPGQRVYNADYLVASVREARRLGLGGVFYHPHAGLTANVDELGPKQIEAWELFVKETGAVVVPPPPIADPLNTLGDEAIDSAIVIAYRELLGRAPDPFGLQFYGDRLRDGRMDVPAMEADIKASAEYKQRHGG